jgi:hypothetical protein
MDLFLELGVRLCQKGEVVALTEVEGAESAGFGVGQQVLMEAVQRADDLLQRVHADQDVDQEHTHRDREQNQVHFLFDGLAEQGALGCVREEKIEGRGDVAHHDVEDRQKKTGPEDQKEDHGVLKSLGNHPPPPLPVLHRNLLGTQSHSGMKPG